MRSIRRIEGVSAYIRRLSSTCPGVRAAGCPRFLALCPCLLQAGLYPFAGGLHLVNPLVSISLCKSMTAALASGVLMFSPMTTIPAFRLVNFAWILTPSSKLRLNRPTLGTPTVSLGRIRVISSFQAGGTRDVGHLVGEDVPFPDPQLLEYVNLSLQDPVALSLLLTRA